MIANIQFIKQVIKDMLPPVALRKYYDLNLTFKGNYSNWEEAKKASIGYDSDIILNKTKEAMLRVKNGECPFARDSVLFDSVQYYYPVLVGLLKAALDNEGELRIMDFGGSLGVSYYQHRNFLKGIRRIIWGIVEQPNFTACGRQLFESEELKFYYSIEECYRNVAPHVALLSGSVSYVENPYLLLEDLLKWNFGYLIFDRTVFLKSGPDRLAIHKVPANIYKCSYPIWLLNYDKFMAKLLPKYDLLVSFDSIDRVGGKLLCKGFILKLKG